MKEDTWRRLQAEFDQFPFLRAGPIADEEIDDASAKLGLSFPEDYREFLLRYGAGIVGPYPIFGLRPVEPMGNRWSVVEVNRHYRADEWPGVERWLIISADHAGNPMGIGKDSRLWVSDHGHISVIAVGFEDFIRKECLGVIE